MPEQVFRAKFNGSCAAGRRCLHGGRILVGQEIVWNRKRRGIVWHSDCRAEVKDDATPPTPPGADQGGASAGAEQAEQAEQEQGAAEAQAQDEQAGEAGAEAGAEKEQEQEQSSDGQEQSSGSGNPPPKPDDPLVAALVKALKPWIKGEVDADKLKREVAEAVGQKAEGAFKRLQERFDKLEQRTEPKAHRIEIVDPKAPDEVKDLGLQHKQFPLLLQALQARTSDGHRINVWITGPAGSGKTTAAFNAAKALGLEYAFTGAIDTPYPLLGFVDAQGKVVRTPFREVYEKGGVFLFDEYDGSHPSATLPFNAALANGHCAFPDVIVQRHKDFVAIAAANTWGLGGTGDYVGRNRLDAASLDRFVSLPWEVDEALELATAGHPDWTRRVQAVRANVANKGIRMLITPRASYFGAALLAVGIAQTEVERIVLRKGMTDDQWESVC